MRPDDIPQEIWRVASGIAEMHSLAHRERASSIEIARAIMAAKAEEREACAKMADEYAVVHGPKSEYDEDGWFCESSALGIAELIRSRT